MLKSEYINILRQFLLIVLFFCTSSSIALELVMIEQAGCPHCKRFDEEIASAYPKTIEGKRAPLRRVDLHAPWPADLSKVRKELFTPTFILVDNNKELARLRGYPGDEHFWFLLNQMFDSIDEEEQ